MEEGTRQAGFGLEELRADIENRKRQEESFFLGLYWKTHRGFRRACRFFRYDLHNGLRNLWIWFPVIWNNREWDHDYLWRLMGHQLVLMAKNSEEHGYHLGSEEIARQMRVAAECCKRLSEGWEPGGYSSRSSDQERWWQMHGQNRGLKKLGLRQRMPVNPALRILTRELRKHSLWWWE